MPLIHPTKKVQSSSQKDFRNFVDAKDTIANILTDLIAIYGLSFYTVAKSKRLREFALDKGQKIHSSSIFIKSILLDHAKDIKAQLAAELKDTKANNFRLSFTVDEYTSIKMCCYMNINVHTNGSLYNLGLVRVVGSMPFEKAVEIVSKK